VRKTGSLSVTLIIAGVLLTIGSTFLIFIMPNLLKPDTSVWLGNGIFKAKLATNDYERAKGLGGVEKLDPDSALLMVFPSEGRWGIVMRDMKIPIDVIWLDKDKKVVSIVKNFEPGDSATREPVVPAKYVIELPAGTVDSKSINKNETAIFQIDNEVIK